MSFNYVTIAKNSKEFHEKEYCQEGVRGAGYQSIGVGKKTRGKCIKNIRVQQWKKRDAKDSRCFSKINFRKHRTKKRFRTLRFIIEKSNKKLNLFPIGKKISYSFSQTRYNPIILKIKGLNMTREFFSKLITHEHIENELERKLKGFIGLFESFEISTDDEALREAFVLLADSMKNIVEIDIADLKKRVEFMNDALEVA